MSQDQPDFRYHECPSCSFDCVLPKSVNWAVCCPICAEDNGRDVQMTSRVAKDTDTVEGRDWRREQTK